MADDHETPTNADSLLQGMRIERLTPSRQRNMPAMPIPKHQAISTGQWYRPITQTGDIVDDFTGQVVSTITPEIGQPLGPQLTSEAMQAAKDAKQVAELVQPMTEAARLKAAFDPYLREKFPERFKLRRNIDMTVHYPPPVPNDRTFQASQAKVAPSKSKPVKPSAKVPPRRKPTAPQQ